MLKSKVKIGYILIGVLLPLWVWSNEPRKFTIRGYAQGTDYTVIYYAQDSVVSVHEIKDMLASLDSSLSIYKPYSTISQFNDSDKGTKVDGHLKKVVEKSLEAYVRSQGTFDITIYPIVRAWGFAEKTIESLPDTARIQELLTCVGSDKIMLRNDSLIKSMPCVKIDVNGIAQGYSVDCVADFLESREISCYLVEIGGELRVKGKKPDGEYMKVGIEMPADFAYQQPIIGKVLTLERGAVTTSGDYRKYVESNGSKIIHLMDPRTGFSIKTNMISVTVVAEDAITADAYDNVLMGMGVEEALRFLEGKKMEAYFIYRDDDGRVKDAYSRGFKKFINETEM
ncbi:FAD:protein FMN transferase [Parapedobacter sp. SGR-10]|uniref:FAD:protein FMN transferase n=1 Tax=Parapedobacter sp. SGR-10 TaxID=2710879 RepID=UPI0013D70D9F|nr:FAD:protein FMN transferase [Parapedobacter sp. SGR-10]NGF57725.1 FAD:protein FMN transferase [Parapedobacter sp. SGR-10]